MDAAIDPSKFGPRGAAYLKALEANQQTVMLQAAATHEENQQVLQPVKGEADQYFSPRDVYTPTPNRER